MSKFTAALITIRKKSEFSNTLVVSLIVKKQAPTSIECIDIETMRSVIKTFSAMYAGNVSIRDLTNI